MASEYVRDADHDTVTAANAIGYSFVSLWTNDKLFDKKMHTHLTPEAAIALATQLLNAANEIISAR